MNPLKKHAANPKPRRSREPPDTPLTAGPSPAIDQPDRPPAPGPPQPPVWKELLSLLGKIAAICLAFLLLFTFLFGLFLCGDGDMHPAVKEGDVVIFYRIDKRYIAGDVVVLEFAGEKQVRRVIAAAGDTVDIADGRLIINGAVQREADVHTPTERYEGGPEFPLTLGEGQVFVLGDARANATDSRVYGAVETKDTLGKVMAIFRRRGI